MTSKSDVKELNITGNQNKAKKILTFIKAFCKETKTADGNKAKQITEEYLKMQKDITDTLDRDILKFILGTIHGKDSLSIEYSTNNSKNQALIKSGQFKRTCTDVNGLPYVINQRKADWQGFIDQVKELRKKVHRIKH